MLYEIDLRVEVIVRNVRVGVGILYDLHKDLEAAGLHALQGSLNMTGNNLLTPRGIIHEHEIMVREVTNWNRID